MLRSSCQEVAEWIGTDRERLSAAARLRVEQHLEECLECREELALSRTAHNVFAQSSPVLSDASRERVLARALARAAEGKIASQRPPARTLWVGATLVSAAAAAMLLWVNRGDEAVQTPQTAAIDVAANTAPLDAPAHAAYADDTWLDVQTARSIEFAHARVEIAPGSRLKFAAQTSVLTLDAGEVDVNVDPAPGKPFWVHTQSFRVQVLGTQFIVTPERVSVREGHVQITDHQGNVLARDLAAGTSFSLHQAEKTKASAPHAPAASSTSKTQVPEAQGATRDVSAILTQARKAMGKNQTDTATRLLDSLRGVTMTRGEQAEGSTLRAEIALLEQSPTRALAQYEELARRFRDLPAGENAAFAATQLAHRSAPTREKALLQSYLARYPKGRFADEVREKLRGM